ncbi:IS1 ORF2 [Shigella sonnei]|uniref:IS1 family transposase n=1 Tax=Shigella sonnei TaxID=624 RepID=UPI000DA56070|nr:IS1 family transposase [Shigella sonnei]SRV08846.1 IS1 ORF2 [Shigella sonnei]
MIDVLGPEKRRRRTTQEKIAIVQQSFEPGMTVSLVARQHGVAASQLFLWRKQYQEGSLTAVAAGEQVVPASELAAAMKQIKELQRWLFYAYDSLRKTVVAHVFGERTMATLGRLMSLLSPFDVVIWMTDGWPLYESRLKGKLHVISKRYTQRIERHNLNLRQHLARLGRKSLSFSKSVELHDKVIGHYLNIKHYQ